MFILFTASAESRTTTARRDFKSPAVRRAAASSAQYLPECLSNLKCLNAIYRRIIESNVIFLSRML